MPLFSIFFGGAPGAHSIDRGLVSGQRRQLVENSAAADNAIDQGGVSVKLVLYQVVQTFQQKKD